MSRRILLFAALFSVFASAGVAARQDALQPGQAKAPSSQIKEVQELEEKARQDYQNGNYEKALPQIERALALKEQSGGAEQPALVRPLNLAGRLYTAKGDYAQAEKALRRAAAIAEKSLGAKHPEVARTLLNHAQLYRAEGKLDKAIEQQNLAAEIIEFNQSRHLLAGSALFADFADLALSLHLQNAPNNPQALAAAVTALLRQKGRAAEAMTDSLARWRRYVTTQDQALFDQLSGVRSQLASLLIKEDYDQQNAETYRARVGQLTRQMEQLEAGLGSRIPGLQAQLQPVTLGAVQSSLPPNTALLEFVVYHPMDSLLQQPGPARYIAYVLAAQSEMYWVDLGEAREIDDAVHQLRLALGNPRRTDYKKLAQTLDNKIMAPVRSLLDKTRHLLIAPDGALNLVPFAALVNDKGRYLVEQYSFSSLTSGRDLLRLANRVPSRQPAVIVAHPDFGARPDCLPAKRPAANKKACDIPPPGYAAPLPSTLNEAQAIHDVIAQMTVLTEATATEATLKQIEAPSILHIATHGFFPAPSPAPPETSLPGILLAGANLRKSSSDDGVLSAQEIAGLNLWGTKLVVLSASGSSLGQLKNGESVYSLLQAWVLAGAETQVMNLLPVSDEVRRELLLAYYRALMGDPGRAAALRQVQLQVLQSDQHQHPYYWASFIVAGEWANFAGRR